MDNAETIVGNMIIAEYMGLQHQMDFWCGCNALQYQEWCDDYEMLPYYPNNNWNLLMPVITKIKESLIGNVEKASFRLEANIKNSLWCVNIEATWNAVIEYIKWYKPKND